MKSLLKIQIMALIITVLLLILPNAGLAQRLGQNEEQDTYAVLQDDPGVAGKGIVPVYFGLRDNNKISPELPQDGKKDNIATCPKGFVPAAWSILGFFGRTEWRDVGTWSTPKIPKALQARGGIKFRIWVSYSGSGSYNGDLEFNWIRNDEIIGQARVTHNFHNDMGAELIDVNGQLSNQTPFQVNDVFSLNIRCQNNFNGAQILFGSREHNTAVMMQCNPIDLLEIKGTRHGIKGLYNDAFNVRPNALTYIVKIDEILENSIPEINFESTETASYRTVSWSKKLNPGTYKVELGLSYMGEDNETIALLIQDITIKKQPEPTLFGLPLWLAYLIITIITLIILIAVPYKVYSWRQERLWMEQMDQEHENPYR